MEGYLFFFIKANIKEFIITSKQYLIGGKLDT